MNRLFLFGAVAALASTGVWGQADNRTIIGSGNEFLSAGPSPSGWASTTRGFG